MSFLDAIEKASPEVLEALVDQKLAAVVAHAQAHAPMYRERLAGMQVRSRADLLRVPVLNKDTFMAAGPPGSEAGLTRPLGDAYVFRSGGSTGDPKFSAFSTDEFRQFVRFFLRTYYAAGLRPSDRVGNLFAAGSLYASFVFINRMLEEMGVLNFPFSNTISPALLARHVRLFGINTLLGFPAWLLQVAGPIAEAGGRIEKIFYAGEHLYEDDRRYLRETLGCRIIASAGYAAVDTGLIGYQCEASSGGVHHVMADHCYVEFVEPESFEPVAEGEPGLILVTSLDRRLQPVIRYNVGDMGRRVPGPCPCGRTSARFELMRRGDDALRIGYANVTFDEMAAVFAGVPELTATVQMVKERSEHRDVLRFRCEVPQPDAIDAAAMSETLTRAIAQAKPDIGKLLATGYIQPLAFEFLAPGTIPRQPVTGKLRRTLDLT